MLYRSSYVDFKLGTQKSAFINVEGDSAGTKLQPLYDITLTVRATVTMQLNLRQPPMKSSGIINNTICKKKTKNYPSWCFYINHELQKREKRRKCSLRIL